MKRIALALLALCLTGCSTYSLEELRHAELKGNAFQQALAKEYIQFASVEERNYNWASSGHFADKGLTAAYGNDIGPELVADWDMAPDTAQELDKARDDLLTALTPAVTEAKPELAAQAYVAFDRWVQAQSYGWDEAKIARLKNEFEQLLAELQAVKNPKADNGTHTTSYIVFFEWNRASLSTKAAKQVDEVAASLAGEEGYEVILNGHTDSTGLEKFNLTLSKKRAEAVAARLEKGGVAKDAIKIFAFGESDPRVPTGDNVDEPQNRRVEIFIE